MKVEQERGKEILVGRKIHGSKVELKHYFLNGEVESTFHTDIADNCYARKSDNKEIKELVSTYGRNTFVYLDPEGVRQVASSRTAAAKELGYKGNGHTTPFLNRLGCRNVDGSKIQG